MLGGLFDFAGMAEWLGTGLPAPLLGFDPRFSLRSRSSVAEFRTRNATTPVRSRPGAPGWNSSMAEHTHGKRTTSGPIPDFSPRFCCAGLDQWQIPCLVIKGREFDSRSRLQATEDDRLVGGLQSRVWRVRLAPVAPSFGCPVSGNDVVVASMPWEHVDGVRFAVPRPVFLDKIIEF